VAGDDLERATLAEEAPVMEAEDDVRHDLEPGVAERGDGGLEVGDGLLLQMVDVADRLVGADHVDERAVDAGRLERARAGLVDQTGVDDHGLAELALDPCDRPGVLEVRHASLDAHPAGDEQPAVAARGERLGEREEVAVLRDRAHALEHRGLAVVALERTARSRDAHGREALRVRRREFLRRVALDPGRVEVDRAAEARAPERERIARGGRRGGDHGRPPASTKQP
jgi:hypothetical protein